MNKYIAIAATNKAIVENWGGTSRFTNDAITQLAETAHGKPVLFDFDEDVRIGRVVSAKNVNGKLVVTFEIEPDYVIDNKQRLVPGFIVDTYDWDEHKKGILRTIKKAKSISYGLTCSPAEKDLPEIFKTL